VVGIRVKWTILTQVGNSVKRSSKMVDCQWVVIIIDERLIDFSLQSINLVKPFLKLETTGLYISGCTQTVGGVKMLESQKFSWKNSCRRD
jgi:hypothetical protein